MPLFVWILIGVVIYLIGGWITTGIFDGTRMAEKFDDNEMFGLFIIWPLVALKGLFYAIGKSGRGVGSALFKLVRYW